VRDFASGATSKASAHAATKLLKGFMGCPTVARSIDCARAGVRRADAWFHHRDENITNLEMGSTGNKKRTLSGTGFGV
jgi:hypothetical protein